MVGRMRFGEFTLDSDTRELHRGTECVPLSPKALRLLEVLLEHSPKALSKEILQERLWPETVVVEKNLVNLVAEIRRALGDNPARPQFVRTVHRFGYAFVAVIEQLSPDRSKLTAAQFVLTWRGGRTDLIDGQHVVGRDPEVELSFDSPGVSRRHALLRVSGASVTIEDLGSKNGTFVGGRRIDSETALLVGDRICVGSLEITLRALTGLATTETALM